MNHLRISLSAICLLLLSGCTTTPEKYKRKSAGEDNKPVEIFSAKSMTVNSETSLSAGDNQSKLQAIATAGVGTPQVYVDQRTGRTVELTVQSEYFSANGRVCRRYSESLNGRAVPGVSCRDDKLGWTDIALSSFVR